MHALGSATKYVREEYDTHSFVRSVKACDSGSGQNCGPAEMSGDIQKPVEDGHTLWQSNMAIDNPLSMGYELETLWKIKWGIFQHV